MDKELIDGFAAGENDVVPTPPIDGGFDIDTFLETLDEKEDMARPTKLTGEVQDRLVMAIRAGNYLETACAYAGIDYSTYRRWFKRGMDEFERVAEDRRRKIRQSEEGFCEFCEAVTRARAEVEMRNVALVQKAAMERDVTKTVTTERVVVTSTGQVLPGPDGKPMREVTTRTETHREFEWRAALEWLARSFPERWGNKVRQEITGKDGKPIQVQNVEVTIRSTDRADRHAGA